MKTDKPAQNQEQDMPIDPAALKAEILTNPDCNAIDPHAAVQGHTYVESGDVEDIARILNAPGNELVDIPTLTSDVVRKIVVPAAMVMPAVPALQAKWAPFMSLLQGTTSTTNDDEFKGLMAALVADFGPLCGQNGVPAFNQARIDTYTKRPASRAEILFGVGTRLTARDVSISLNEQG